MTPVSGNSGWTRRSFLAGALATGVAACTGTSGDGSGGTTSSFAPPASAPPAPQLLGDPFSLGVASGDPLPGAVVIWTMLTGRPDDVDPLPAESFDVLWEMAGDRSFDGLLTSGVTPARPELGHSLHVDVSGLEPATTYWYRFRIGPYTSPVGRTRTAPATADSPSRLAFAVASCQGYQTGYFGAYRHMADEDLDVVLFVGDYIYELEASIDTRPHGRPPPQTLDEYRSLYSLNRSDPDLQTAHAAFPWIVTWDDHEVEDNYADLEPGAIGLAINPDARSTFAQKRAAAYQAWWEFMPVRLDPPVAENITIHRSFDFGDLATMAVLDNRQYRTPLPSGEGAGNLPRGAGGGPQLEAAFDEDATYLGLEQEAWLEDVLDRSTAKWPILVQQTVMAEFDRFPDDPGRGFSMDSWDGYVAPRRRLLEYVADNDIENLVSVGGDIHSSAVTELRLDYDDPTAPVVGSEFVAPSISALELLPDGAVEAARTNPHVRLYETDRHGYLVCTVEPDTFRATYRYVSSITDPEPTIATGTSWVTTAGEPGPRPA
jgi:alkaline phosphatase D